MLRQLTFNDLLTVSADLQRPECVRVGLGDELCASDSRGGVSIIGRNGRSHLVKAQNVSDLSEPLVPNGIHPE